MEELILILHQILDTKDLLKNIVNQKYYLIQKVQNHIHIEKFFQIKFYYNLNLKLKTIKKEQIRK